MTFVNKIYKSDQLLDLISSSMFQREKSFMTYWTAGYREIKNRFVWKNHLVCKNFTCGGKKVKYTRWGYQDPNNHKGIENCIQLRWTSSGFKWADQACSDKACVICQILK